ncbi:MAG: DinB family protein [Bacteroidetes bacterium]|nr:MAG: DinB family protein [Bacteroidota bacterium]
MLNDKIKRLQNIKSLVEESFGKLSIQQLSKKPSPEKWSIAECLQHLITSNETYFPVLDKLAIGYIPTFWEKNNPFSRSIGKNMVDSLGVVVKKKFKSPKLFLPKKIKFPENIVSSFCGHQDHLIEKMEKLRHLEGKKVIISSPVSPLITLPLTDCLEVLTGHEERHFNQAMSVLNLIISKEPDQVIVN